MNGLNPQQKGVLYNVTAHLFWGGMASYFGLIRHISATEIAVNRGLWSLPLALLIVWWFGQLQDVIRVFRQPRNLGLLALTGGIVVFNWGFYVWSIEVGRALESSLGYFINPLLNIVAGYFFFGERFSRAQLVAIALATVGVIVQTVATGAVPWLGLMLGASFSLYGLLRKMTPVGATQGFCVEVLLQALPLIAMQMWLVDNGLAKLGGTAFDTLMLMGCGVMTTGALVFFALSLKLIRYSTAGILQYISPSIVFLTAVFLFGEPMDRWKFLSFVLIWIALGIYTVSALLAEKSKSAL